MTEDLRDAVGWPGPSEFAAEKKLGGKDGLHQSSFMNPMAKECYLVKKCPRFCYRVLQVKAGVECDLPINSAKFLR